MVTFSCEACGDSVTKKKLDGHRSQCHNAEFTCLDCHTTFRGTSYRGHTSCITEAEKYEGGMGDSGKKGKGVRWKSQEDIAMESQAMPPPRRHQAYVEEASESQQHSQLNTPVGAVTSKQPSGPPPPPSNVSEPSRVSSSIPGAFEPSPTPPKAPSPPRLSRTPSPAPRAEQSYNVFDFLDKSQSQTQTPVAEVKKSSGRSKPTHDPYGRPYETPITRSRPKSEIIHSQDNSQKKRKRHSIDVATANSPPRSDEEMPDALPSTSHTGLTGGLNGLSTKEKRLSSTTSSSKKTDHTPSHRHSKILEPKKQKDRSSKEIKVKKHRDSRLEPVTESTERKTSDSSRRSTRRPSSQPPEAPEPPSVANGEQRRYRTTRYHLNNRDSSLERPLSQDSTGSATAYRRGDRGLVRERRPSQSPERKRRETRRVEYRYAQNKSGGVSLAKMTTSAVPSDRPTSSSSATVSAHRRSSRERSIRYRADPTSQELIHTPRHHRSGHHGGAGELAPYMPPDRLADMFISLVSKGPDSTKGFSINKVLKRFHRQRFAREGDEEGKVRVSKEMREIEEDCLWRSIRLKKNERGEVVLFF